MNFIFFKTENNHSGDILEKILFNSNKDEIFNIYFKTDKSLEKIISFINSI